MNPVEKVREALNNSGASDIEIKVVDSTIFTVEDAANTIGVPPCEILKSLIFIVDKKTPCLVLMSGANKVDAKKSAQALGGKRGKMMNPDEVFARYGFHVGGVPPIGYDEKLPVVLDTDLFAYKVVWSAAGTDHAFFPVEPERLLAITQGIRADIKKQEQ
ncbi:MAG: YbaK/EbsC family protein [Synergistaceae bacterium]|nr:YbaK/EbsC family protein [Synergistaceae bacterium]